MNFWGTSYEPPQETFEEDVPDGWPGWDHWYEEDARWRQERELREREEEERRLDREKRKEEEREAQRETQRQEQWQKLAQRAEAMKSRIIHDEDVPEQETEGQEQSEAASGLPIYEVHQSFESLDLISDDESLEYTDREDAQRNRPDSSPLIDLNDSSEGEEGDNGEVGNDYDGDTHGDHDLDGDDDYVGGGQDLEETDSCESDQSFGSSCRPDVEQPAASSIDEEQGSCYDALQALFHFFQYKLTHSNGCYGVEDLMTEITGFYLESLQGWFEEQRLGFPGAQPAHIANLAGSRICRHLGPWNKRFHAETCEACDRWLPLYILVCPTCGAKACVSCKYLPCESQ